MGETKQTRAELTLLQNLPLEAKIEKTKQRIREWYNYFNGQVYVSFSGGKDSTVLLHLVRSMYPDVVAVYSATPDYPEIREFVNRQKNVITVNPTKSYVQILKEYGYPVISKEISEAIYYARRGGAAEREREYAVRLSQRNCQQAVRTGGKTTIRKRKELLGLPQSDGEYG